MTRRPPFVPRRLAAALTCLLAPALVVLGAGCRSASPSSGGSLEPNAPTNVEAAVVRYDGVALRWDDSPGARAYRVFRNGEPIGRSSESRFVDLGGPLVRLAPREYAITALGENDSESTRSEPVVTGTAFPRDAVPEPVFDERPEFVELYYSAWESAWSRVVASDAARGFDFPHVAFEGEFRATDAFLSVELARHAIPLLPVTGILDAFHAAQDGSAALVETLGGAAGAPEAPGALAAAEWALFTATGDVERLRRVRGPLERRFALARDAEGGRVALAAEQAMAAEALSKIALALGDAAGHAAWSDVRRAIRERVNDRHWDAADQIYRDIAADGSRSKVTTLEGLRPLAAGIPDRTRAAALVYHLESPACFNRTNRFPSLPPTDPRYGLDGAVEAYDNVLLARGLAAFDFHDLARRSTEDHFAVVASVLSGTGRFFDAYAPESAAPARRARESVASAGGIVTRLIRHGIGLDADVASGTIFFRVGGDAGSLARHGVRHFRFGPRVVSLVCAARRSESEPCDVEIETDGPVAVVVSTPWAEFPIGRVEAGSHRFRLMRPPGITP